LSQGFAERFEEMVRELRQTPTVTLYDEDRGDPGPHAGDPDLVMRELAEQVGIPLDPAFRDCLFAPTHLGCFWEVPHLEVPIRGEVHLLNLAGALLIDEPSLFFGDDDAADATLELLEELRAIDVTPHGGGGELATIRRQLGVSEPEVWYCDPRLDPVRMNIGYRQYLDAALLTKGTYGWQYIFTDVSRGDDRLAGEEWRIDAMLDTFPRLFPHHDYSDLQRRWEERR
jgi:hypothetical protein